MTHSPISSGLKSNSFTVRKSPFLASASLCVSYFILVFQLVTQTASAQGTAAGIDISNTAVVSYDVSGISQSDITSPAAVFTVDRKIDLIVTPGSNTNVNPGDTAAQLSFTLKNQGNDTQQFSLIPDSTLAGDDFDATHCAAAPSTQTLTPDQEVSITVSCDIPVIMNGQPLQSGNRSLISLFATAEKNSDGTPVTETSDAESEMGIDTVFADAAGTDDAARDAMHTARSSYIAITSAKAPVAHPDSIFNPIIPGPANPVVLANITANDTDDGSIDISSIDLDPATAGEQKTRTTNEGEWTVDTTGTVIFTPKAGWSGYQSAITYTVKDNDGIVSSPAELSVSYGHPPVALDDSSTNNPPGNSVTINPLANDSDADGNNTLDKTRVIFIGTGVSADGKSITVANEGTWRIDPHTGEITFVPLASFSGDPADVTYAVADIAGNFSNEASVHIDYKQITNTAELSINKSIVSMRDPDGGNKAISGSVVTYKISINTTGTGNIDNVVITDPTPAGMSYKPNSMYLDNVLLTDNQDTDKADFGVTDPDTATLKLGNISAGSQYEFLLSFVIN